MKISLIAALDESRGIGLRGALPWRLSEDLKRFKRLTMGHHLIMGRKTFEAIGRPLQGRVSIVLSQNPVYDLEVDIRETNGVCVAQSIEEALEIARQSGEEEVFIIGGGEIFNLALPIADRVYLTLVHTVGEADTFFPTMDPEEWEEQHKEFIPADERNDYPSTFYIVERGRE